MDSPEPIAIVGLACRFAGGVDSPEKFWTLLREGRDTIGKVPDDRWQWYAAQSREHANALRDVTKFGAFLDDIQGFDAEFFDLTPREAAVMDPQQRIVLELAWEALEHAGIPPRELGGSDAGVYIGIGSDDYGRRLLEDLPGIEAWTGIGSSYCAVANRVSYHLDLRGPSMAMDTACSSSLVAIHLAVQALRAGECPVALAGGVLIMAAPGLSLVLDAAGATAPDGRSKSFDAHADGYGRGEGGGVVVLKRLSDAQRDGDRVLAVIRGSAIHQDGKTAGIMAPNGDAQAHLMRRAYEHAGVDPATVGYVEAHGTGTRVGDPLEAAAMTEVFGAGRPADDPCLIGSVKPNVGHLEAGAGVAGVIKAVLALHHGEIPPSLNFSTPNPAIPWDTSGLKVVTERTPWRTDGPRRAGVSGYGYGGTIAHVVLESADGNAGLADGSAGLAVGSARLADGNARLADGNARLAVYPLSGASENAVSEYAQRLADHLEQHDTSTVDVGFTLARRRSHLPARAAVVASDREQLIARLRDLALRGSMLPRAGRGLVWVFSGQGSQWTGMARELLASRAEFAAVIEQLEPLFVEELGVSPTAVIHSDDVQPTDVVQPMIFAVQVALAAVWRAHGVQPAAIIGHSVGEIAAAVTAGVLTLEQGARLVCRRSVLLRQVTGKGAMAWVALSPDDAQRQLGNRSDAVVAVSAGTTSAVISGDIPAIEEITEQWEALGIDIRRIDSDVAFHGPHMDPLAGPLAEAAAELVPAHPQIRLYSTALPNSRTDIARNGAYWAANLREKVHFAQAVKAAVEDGYRLFLEVSPHPVVAHSINETLETLGVEDAMVTHTLRRNKPEVETLLTNLGQLHSHGAEVDWTAVWPEGVLAELPTTAWQHKQLWAQEPVARGAATEQHKLSSHTLLGGRTTVHGSTPAHSWTTHLEYESRPYPGDHPVKEVEIIPAAVLLNTFLTAASSVSSWPDLGDVTLRVPVSVTNPRDLQVVLQDGTIRLSSRLVDGEADKGWLTHTTAAIEPHSELPAIGSTPEGFAEQLPTDYVEDRLAKLGVAAMGFPWAIEQLERGDGTLVALVRADRDSDVQPHTWGSILDAALSAASVVFDGPPILRMPAHIHRVTLAKDSLARARITVRAVSEDTVDVEIAALDGSVVGTLSRLRYGIPDGEVGSVTSPRRLVHELTWRHLPLAEYTAPPTVVLVGPDTALMSVLTRGLLEAGIPHRVAPTPEDLLESELNGHYTIVVVPALGLPGELGEVVRTLGLPGVIGEVAVRASWLLARTAQRLADAGLHEPGRLWCVTQGALESTDDLALGQGALWGLGRIVGGEHAEFWGGVVDIGSSPQDVFGLVDALRTVRGEDVVAVRDGELSVPRLHLVEGEPTRAPVRCQPDATYLVTGGMGALGREVAHWLADRGMRRIILAGRTPMPPRSTWDDVTDPKVREQVETVRSLERLGVTVATVAVDIADPAAAEKALDAAALGLPPIRGVVHAAGVLDNRMLSTLDEESLRTVLRPKVNGALVLHGLFPPGSVDFFTLFSSCGQLLGLQGQASYAAANAFLDVLAAHRRSLGDSATTSFGWTSWRGLGMSTSSAVIDAELAARGTADVSVTEAFAAWELAERHDLGYAAVLRTIPLEPGDVPPPLLSELAKDAPVAVEEDERPWLELHGDELLAYLSEEITREVAAETQLAASEVDPHRPLVEMGLDSVMTVRIRRGLERRFRLPLPATLFWDRPTIDAVAALLAERLGGAAR